MRPLSYKESITHPVRKPDCAHLHTYSSNSNMPCTYYGRSSELSTYNLFRSAGAVQFREVCRRCFLIEALVEAVHDGAGIVHVVKPQRMPHLVRQDAHELGAIREFIHVYLLASRGAFIQALFKFASGRSSDGVVLRDVQFENARQAVERVHERIDIVCF